MSPPDIVKPSRQFFPLRWVLDCAFGNRRTRDGFPDIYFISGDWARTRAPKKAFARRAGNHSEASWRQVKIPLMPDLESLTIGLKCTLTEPNGP